MDRIECSTIYYFDFVTDFSVAQSSSHMSYSSPLNGFSFFTWDNIHHAHVHILIFRVNYIVSIKIVYVFFFWRFLWVLSFEWFVWIVFGVVQSKMWLYVIHYLYIHSQFTLCSLKATLSMVEVKRVKKAPNSIQSVLYTRKRRREARFRNTQKVM